MIGLEIGQILEEITPLRVVWAGVGIVTFCLLLMLATRWGDSKPVAKCLVLSLLAHCVLALYGTTVVVALGARQDEQQIVFHLERIEATDPGAETLALDAPPARLLDSFVHRAEIESSPLDLPRPKADLEEPPVRRRDDAEVPIADRTPQIEVPLESPERPRPGQATRSNVEPEKVVVSNTIQPDVGAPEARRPAETPLPGQRQTQVRPRADGADAVRSRPANEEAPTLTENSTAQLPRAEPSRRIVPKAVLAGDRDTPSHQGRPLEPAPIAERPVGTDTGKTPNKSSRPAFVASPSLRQRPGLGQRAEEQVERSRPTPGALALPEREARLSVPSGSLEGGPSVSALAPRTPNPTDDALRFRKRLKRASVYRFRMAPNRSELSIERGGSKASERAVEDGLAWLADHQSPDGRWDADGFNRLCPLNDRCRGPAGIEEETEGHNRESVGGRSDTGVTGLALLAYLGAGYTHQGDRYAENIRRALDWLIAGQADDGSLAGEAAAYAHLYCHAMATIAVCEAYGMTNDSALRAPAEAGIDYIVNAQHPTGGGLALWAKTARRYQLDGVANHGLKERRPGRDRGPPGNLRLGPPVSRLGSRRPVRRAGQLSAQRSRQGLDDGRSPVRAPVARPRPQERRQRRSRRLSARAPALGRPPQPLLLVLRHADDVSARGEVLEGLERGPARRAHQEATPRRTRTRQLGPATALGRTRRPHLLNRPERPLPRSLLPLPAAVQHKRTNRRSSARKTVNFACACSNPRMPPAARRETEYASPKCEPDRWRTPLRHGVTLIDTETRGVVSLKHGRTTYR